MRHFWSIVLAMLLCFSFTFCSSQPVSSYNLSIDPLLVERAVRTGSSFSYVIYVQNHDRFESVTLEAAVFDLFESIYGVYDLIPVGTSPFSLGDWVTFEPAKLRIPPASQGEMMVTITVPRGVSGGRYGAVVLSPSSDVSRTESVSPFVYRMASFIELEIAGGVEKKEAYIADLSVQPSSAYPQISRQVGENAMVYTAEVTNAGNIHIVTSGYLLIQTMDGRTVARYPIGGGRGVIIPQATVALQSVTGKSLSPGTYLARAIIEYGGRRPAVGEVEFTVTDSSFESSAQSTLPLARFRVEPEVVDLPMGAGAFKSLILEVSNTGLEPVQIDSRIVPLGFSVSGEFLPEEERGEAPEWISISPSSFSVEPGKIKRIRLSLRSPRDAHGGYYADLVFATQGKGKTTESGSSILVFVGDVVKKTGEVRIMNIAQQQESIDVDALFTNTGNYHIYVEVDFALRQLHEGYIEEETGRVVPSRVETISSLSLPKSANPVLPEGERIFTFQVPTTLDSGNYEAVIRVDYGADEPSVTAVEFSIERGDFE